MGGEDSLRERFARALCESDAEDWSASSPTVGRPTRVPRVFVVRQATPKTTNWLRLPQRRDEQRPGSGRPSSCRPITFGTLIDYGMTVEQVAEHYGLPAAGGRRMLPA